MYTTKITSPLLSSSHCFCCNGRYYSSSQEIIRAQPYNLLAIKRAKKINNQTLHFLKVNEKYGISGTISLSGNIQPKASSSSDNPSSSWKKRLLGILLTVILPAIGHKGGLWASLKGRIDKAIETVDHVVEVVEEDAEKIVEEKLPGDSKLKHTLESLDDLAKKAVKEAKNAEEIIHEVKQVEEEIEEAMEKTGKSQTKK